MITESQEDGFDLSFFFLAFAVLLVMVGLRSRRSCVLFVRVTPVIIEWAYQLIAIRTGARRLTSSLRKNPLPTNPPPTRSTITHADEYPLMTNLTLDNFGMFEERHH